MRPQKVTPEKTVTNVGAANNLFDTPKDVIKRFSASRLDVSMYATYI